QYTDLNVLVCWKVLEKLNASHVAVGVIENELVNAFRFEEMRKHLFISIWIIRAQDVVSPGVSVTKMPSDFCVYTVTALFDDFANPLVVVLIVGKKGQPGAKILELKILCTGGNKIFHFGVEDRRKRETQLPSVLVMSEIGMPGEVSRSRS